MFRRGAKGTGVKSIELALSMCDQVDIYGFTVDPGYTEWYLSLSLLLSFVHLTVKMWLEDIIITVQRFVSK